MSDGAGDGTSVGAPLRLACADYALSLTSLDDALDGIRELGFAGVSLGLFSGLTSITPEAVHERPDEWADRIREQVDARGLLVADVFGSGDSTEALAVNHPDPAERRRAMALGEDLMTIALGVGAGGITLLPGVRHAGQSREQALQRSAEALRSLVDAARDRGLRLSVEPHLGSIVQTPEQIVDLLELVPGLELTLDYSHFTVQGIPDAEVHPLLTRTRHFHCRGAARDLIQVDFDANTIDFAGIVGEMRRVGYAGWIEVEYLLWGADQGGRACDTFAESRRYREFLGALEGVGS